MTKLEAVQEVYLLAGLPGRPSVLDTNGNSLVAQAEFWLDRVFTRMQTERWRYNTRVNVTLTADGSGNLNVPTGTTTIDTARENASDDLVQLGNRLYDREQNTATFDAGTTKKVEYTLNYALECAPLPIRQATVDRAAFELATYANPQPYLLVTLKKKAEDSYTLARRWDAEMADHNVFDTADAAGIIGRDEDPIFLPINRPRQWSR